MYLTAGLHRSLQKHPDKTATVTGARRQTFRQLADRVAHTAGALQSLGLQPGERLSVLAHNSDRMMELLLAGWWAGLVVVPVNAMCTPSEIRYYLQDSGARVAMVAQELLPQIMPLVKPDGGIRPMGSKSQRIYPRKKAIRVNYESEKKIL